MWLQQQQVMAVLTAAAAQVRVVYVRVCVGASYKIGRAHV